MSLWISHPRNRRHRPNISQDIEDLSCPLSFANSVLLMCVIEGNICLWRLRSFQQAHSGVALHRCMCLQRWCVWISSITSVQLRPAGAPTRWLQRSPNVCLGWVFGFDQPPLSYEKKLQKKKVQKHTKFERERGKHSSKL